MRRHGDAQKAELDIGPLAAFARPREPFVALRSNIARNVADCLKAQPAALCRSAIPLQARVDRPLGPRTSCSVSMPSVHYCILLAVSMPVQIKPGHLRSTATAWRQVPITCLWLFGPTLSLVSRAPRRWCGGLGTPFPVIWLLMTE